MEISSVTKMQQWKGRRLVLFPVPLQGHLNPMFELANILHSRGFSITIIHTNFNSPNPSSYPHFTFHAIPDCLSKGEASTTDVVELLSLLNANCISPFQDCLTRLLSDASEEPIACLITDVHWHFTQDVADSLKVRRIMLRTSSASSFLVFAAFPLLRERGYLPLQDSQLEKLVPDLPPLKVKDLPVINTRDPEKFHQLIAGMMKAKASSGIIWNSFEDLEQPALATIRNEFLVPIFPIGPFHRYSSASSSSLLVQDQSSVTWLDRQASKSVVYVSFGSIAAMDETEFLEIIWGLANSKQPFLFVVRPGLIRGSEWLESVPSGFLEMMDGSGHFVKWAPQQQVLAHPSVGAFWTHAGWNSTLESISEGVPMICHPCFSDQKVTARYVSEVWRIGVQLENGLDRREVERAIRRLMVEKEGKEIKERCTCLKEKVNLCQGQGGSSFQTLDSLIDHILSL